MGVKIPSGADNVDEVPQWGQTIRSVAGGGETVNVASGTSGTVTLDLALGNIFTVTPTAAITAWTVNNRPGSGKMCRIQINVTQGATPYTVALPTNGHYHGPSPIQVANKDCILICETTDDGAVWHCWASTQA